MVHYVEVSEGQANQLAGRSGHLSESLAAVLDQIGRPSSCQVCPCSGGIVIATAHAYSKANPANFAAATRCKADGNSLRPIHRDLANKCERLVPDRGDAIDGDLPPMSSRR